MEQISRILAFHISSLLLLRLAAMEFHHINGIIYEMMRVKEDRLLMKWEDDRGVLLRNIQSLTDTNTELVIERERQKEAYNNLVHTIASFNPITSTSLSPTSRNNNNIMASKVASSSSSSALKRARIPQQDDGEFISINRSKQLKTGPMDAFFNSAVGSASASKSASKPINKSRSKQKAPAPAAAAVDPNDHEWWNVPEGNAVARSNKASSKPSSAGSSSSALGSVATTAAEDLDMDVITQILMPSGNPMMQNQQRNIAVCSGQGAITSHPGVKNNDNSMLLDDNDDVEGASDVDDDVTVDPDGNGDGNGDGTTAWDPFREAAGHPATTTTTSAIPRTTATSSKTFIDLISPVMPCGDDDAVDAVLEHDDANMHYANTNTHVTADANNAEAEAPAGDVAVDADATQDCSQTTCGSTPGTNNNHTSSAVSKPSSISSHSSGSSAVPAHWAKHTHAYGEYGALPTLPSQSQTQSQLLSQEFNVTVRKSNDFPTYEAEKEAEMDEEETDNPYFPALKENTCTLLQEEIIDLSVSPQKEVKFKSRRVSGSVTFGDLDCEGEGQGNNAHAAGTHTTQKLMGPPVLSTDATGALFSPKSGTRGRRSKEARTSLDRSNTSLLVDACAGASPEASPASASNRSAMTSVSHKFAQSEPVSGRNAHNRNTEVNALTTASPLLAATALVSSVRSAEDNTTADAVDYMAESGSNTGTSSAQNKGRGRPEKPAEVVMYAQECTVTTKPSSSVGSGGSGSKAPSSRRLPIVAEKENLVNRNTTAIAIGSSAASAASSSSSTSRVGKLNAPTGATTVTIVAVPSGVNYNSNNTSSSSGARGNGGDNGTGNNTSGSKVNTSKCVETVRSKIQRAALPGHTCEECARFYETMQQQGIYNFTYSQMKREVLQTCSRHKARWTPPSTPEGFWNLTLETPDDWKMN